MKTYYIESSAWIKRYVREQGSARVKELFEGPAALVGSGLGRLEVRAALGRRMQGCSSSESLAGMLARLDRDWAVFFQLRVSDDALERAGALGLRFGLSGAEAVELASASIADRTLLGGRGEIVVASANGRVLAAADQLGLGVWDPAAG